MRDLRRCSATIVLLAAGCASQVIDQAYYEEPDQRGIQATQILLHGTDDLATPDGFDLVGYNRYRATRRSGATETILIMVPEWARGAGWLDPLARDLVAGKPQLEVWTLNRRQVFLNGATDPAAAPWIGGWGLDLALRDLAIIVRRARTRARGVLLAGWGDGGGLLALCHAARSHAPASGKSPWGETAPVDGLILYDTTVGWSSEGERRFAEQAGTYIRYLDERGVLSAAVLNPRSKLRVPLDFLFLERAALEAERAPRALSTLAAHHPDLQEDERRWTNRALFAWAFDREPGEEVERGPLAAAFGLPFGALQAVETTPGEPPTMELRAGTPAREPYSIEQALIPFHSPGGPFEYFPPLRFWLDLFDLADAHYRSPGLGIEGWDSVRSPLLFLASAELQAVWKQLEIHLDTNGAPPAITDLGRRAAGARSFRFEALPGDDSAPLLLAGPRARAVAIILDWMAALETEGA